MVKHQPLGRSGDRVSQALTVVEALGGFKEGIDVVKLTSGGDHNRRKARNCCIRRTC
jgi:hypothetical protein